MFEKVAGILRECMEKDVAEITEDMDLVADLGLSSLDVMDAALAFEEEFGVEIPMTGSWNLRRLGILWSIWKGNAVAIRYYDLGIALDALGAFK